MGGRGIKMSRTLTVTEKISRDQTGLHGSMFVHVEHDQGRIVAVKFSEKRKDDEVLDRMLEALGESITNLAADLRAAYPKER